MKTRLVLALLATALLAPCATPVLRADTAGFTATGGFATGSVGTTVGYTFTLASSFRITQLGFWDSGADGLAAGVPMMIWNSAGVLLASATVPAGTMAGEVNQYLYVTLAAPVTLAAGTYTTAGYVANNNDFVQLFVSTLTPAAGITYGAARSAAGNAYPTGDYTGAGGNSYFGPNFQFSTVPEPSTWAAVAAGAGLLGVIALRRRTATR